MYSVIIPTLWKQNIELFKEVLIDLGSNDDIKEIILIDNDPAFDRQVKEEVLNTTSKLIHLQMQENIFVNPAWNLGVKHSTQPYIVILNDDMWCNPSINKILEVYQAHPMKDISPFGMSSSCYTGQDPKTVIIDKEIEVSDYEGRGTGWGCLFMMNRNNWEEIPEDLKVWFGDDYIAERYYREKITVYNFRNVFCTPYATTETLPQFSEVKLRDREVYFEKYHGR